MLSLPQHDAHLPAAQIALVVDHQSGYVIGQAGKNRLLPSKRHQVINDCQYQISLRHGSFGTADTFTFYFVLRVTQAGGIGQVNGQTCTVNGHLNHIPGSPWFLTHDHSIGL